MALYKQKLPGVLKPPELKELDELEVKLSYEDIRFYRSIARAELRKDIQVKRKIEEEKKKQQEAQAGKGWMGWVWGSSSNAHTEEILGVQLNDQRKKELFEALDYDEKAATAAAFEPPKESVKARISAKLQKGSLSLRSEPDRDPGKSIKDIMSIVFDDVGAKIIQRPTSFDAIASLGDLHVYDGTSSNTQYPEIIRIKPGETPSTSVVALPTADSGIVTEDQENKDALLMVKFEQNPLDDRADNGLTVRLKSMEIVYHKGYVEAIYQFFKPPATQMESVSALLVSKNQTILLIFPDFRARMSRVRPLKASDNRQGQV